ncbi:DUF5994 family protein [Streptomyces gobiensis]|uniref:DUF5994 family protein n=1 Tax=Streptomyces gobiensis TaxID=2875706 RepID=UPI001E3EA01E|nr:DUF5994 family protein [Streptomyces gobiensis]UGY92776.1 DUF5994 family protein [Streptomyces gobiensis]
MPPPPARVSLAPEVLGPHCVDGAWWPRTRGLHRELLPLLRALAPRWDDITRVTVHADMWRPGHRSIQLAGRTIRIFLSDRAESRHTICLLSHGGGCCDLLVVPPPTIQAEAELLLAAAGRPHASRPPAEPRQLHEH